MRGMKTIKTEECRVLDDERPLYMVESIHVLTLGSSYIFVNFDNATAIRLNKNDAYALATAICQSIGRSVIVK